jgi:hypothetical protein
MENFFTEKLDNENTERFIEKAIIVISSLGVFHWEVFSAAKKLLRGVKINKEIDK